MYPRLKSKNINFRLPFVAGREKLSRVRKIELLLLPSFPKTISITIALQLVDNKFLAFWIISDLIREDLCDEDNIYIYVSFSGT